MAMKEFKYDNVNNRYIANDQITLALDDFHRCVGLSDHALKILLEFYRNAEAMLSVLGPHYNLAWRAVTMDLVTLERFERARLERN